MNSSYLYGVFKCCEINGLPDIYLALAYYEADNDLPDGLTNKQVTQFIGNHYEELVAAYAYKDPIIFEETVKKCIKDDEAKKKAEIQ